MTPTQDERSGLVVLESLPGTPAVPFEAIYPLLSAPARLEVELVATRLVATQALTERAELESHTEMLANQTGEPDPDPRINTTYNLGDQVEAAGQEATES